MFFNASASNSIMERDVFRAKFMESRGWKIIRVFSRDYFLNPNRVLNTIIRLVDKNRIKTAAKPSPAPASNPVPTPKRANKSKKARPR